MSLEPTEHSRLVQLVHTSLQNGQYEAGENFCARMLAEDQWDLQANMLLVLVCLAKGEYRRGREIALQASAAEKLDVAGVASLISRLRGFAEYQAIDRVFARLPDQRDIPTEALLALSAEASLHGDGARAAAYVKEALRRDPAHPPSMLAAGGLCLIQGNIEESERYLERALAANPFAPAVYWQLSKLKKYTAEANHIGLIARLLKSAKRIDAEGAAMLYTALHKELDDIKEYGPAWEALERACSSKRSVLRYSTDETAVLIDELIKSSEMLGSAPPTVANGGLTPVFIVGMHRSGTTLMEQMITCSPEACAGGELYDFPCAMKLATDTPSLGAVNVGIARKASASDFQEVGRFYLDRAEWRAQGKKIQTDKLPSNFLNIGYILQALPNAKVIHMSRDPMETCFSNLRELFSGVNQYSYRQDELAGYYLQYKRLMNHWNSKFGDRILAVDYSKLTAYPADVMKEVAEFCGIVYREEMNDPRNNKKPVATASAVQVRGGISRESQPKWAPYASKLQPLIGHLREGGVHVADEFSILSESSNPDEPPAWN